MPIYEYRCQKCGQKTEAIQRIGEKPLKICPHCGGSHLKKLWAAPAIQFKGSGWYVTDYARAKSESEKPSREKPEKAEKTEKAEAAEKPAEKPAEKKKEKKGKD